VHIPGGGGGGDGLAQWTFLKVGRGFRKTVFKTKNKKLAEQYATVIFMIWQIFFLFSKPKMSSSFYAAYVRDSAQSILFQKETKNNNGVATKY
jgi:hypothetical protein